MGRQAGDCLDLTADGDGYVESKCVLIKCSSNISTEGRCSVNEERVLPASCAGSECASMSTQ